MGPPFQYNVLVEATRVVVFAGGKRTRAQAESWEGVQGDWHAKLTDGYP